MTAHGFRAHAARGIRLVAGRIERQLAHKASGPLGAAYDCEQFLTERRKMMQAWGDYPDTLRNGGSDSFQAQKKLTAAARIAP